MQQAVLGRETSKNEAVLHVAFELSNSKWKLGFSEGKRIREVTIPARELEAVESEIAKAKERFRLGASSRVVSCYEAGRDGFWIHRYLESRGVENVVVEPASVQVDRRARRAKTDRLDVRKLLNHLMRFVGGERDVWRVVRVPSEEAEDARRPQRERDRLKKEATQHKNRIRSLLVTHGIILRPGRGFLRALEGVKRWDGSPLPTELNKELIREYRRLELVEAQMAEIEAVEKERIAKAETETHEKIRRLSRLRGIGNVSGSVLVTEFFGWRDFNNRREVGALAGLTGSPYNSGDSERDQGISKAGNRRVRAVMIELAWGWLRWQGESKLANWFRDYVGQGKKRIRRIAIVAMARKLLIDLWHYLEHGVIPEGAVLKV